MGRSTIEIRLKDILSSHSWLNSGPIRRAMERIRNGNGRSSSRKASAVTEAGETVAPGRSSPSLSNGTADRPFATGPKDVFTRWAEIQLEIFLQSGASLTFASVTRPKISVVLVLFNRAELTLSCLRSLLMEDGPSYEVVIVDNNSSDATSTLLTRVSGATILRNRENVHFLNGVNQAIRAARGQHLLLLNNDTELLPGALEAALTTLEAESDIGAVGGKLILPDGRLQEAGSIIWRDGSCLGYSRGLDPFDPVAMFRRDVDYCSAAFLLTPKSVFNRMRGFDIRYAPAYYEETDYCMRLWAEGLRVVYEPFAAALHHEFASSGSATEAIDLQRKHQEIFVQSHRDPLQKHHPPTTEHVLEARFASQRSRKKILFIDDTIPHLDETGPGAQTSETLRTLVARGDAPTFMVTGSSPDWQEIYSHLPHEVEVLPGAAPDKLQDFLEARRGYYDTIQVNRPGNITHLNQVVKSHPEWFEKVRIIETKESSTPIKST